MNELDMKVFALISAGTVAAIGLLKKLVPQWAKGREEVLALVLPLLFVTLAKVLGGFHATGWVDALLFAVGGGVVAQISHDKILNPVIKGESKP